MKFRPTNRRAPDARPDLTRKLPATGQVRSAARSVVEPLEERWFLSAALNPIADADTERQTADSNYANANFGADNELRVSLDAADTKEIFVKFDISAVTSVGSATIDLAGGARDLLTSPQNVSVFAGNSTTWVEGNGLQPTVLNPNLNLDDNPVNEIRWNNRPGSSGASLDTVLIDVAQVYSWNVTSYLQAQKSAGATTVSFVFRGTSGVGESFFGSRESSTPPVLNIDDDATPPTAAATSPNVTTSGGTSQTVTVTYTDDAGIDPTTIDTSDISVTGPGGTLAVTGVSINSSNPKAVVATYTVTPPGGTWDGADNGTYNIAVQTGQVADYGANTATGTGSFTVNIPTDVTPPIASTFTAQPITTPGGTNYTFTVTYTDNVALNAGSIDATDVSVAKSGGASLTVTGVAKSGSGNTVNATYSVNAPGGTWTAADNGTYTIVVGAGNVADAAGNLIARTTGSFQVNIPDTNNPIVTITPVPTVATAGVTTTQITVTYSDNQLVDSSTIDSGDLTVIQDGGSALAVTLLSKNPSGNAGSIVAVYSVAAPGGFWNNADNGSYTISVGAGVVRDTSNNGNALAGDSFEVNIPSTAAIVDPAFNGGSAISTGFVGEAMATDSLGRILIAGRQGDRAAGTSQSVLQRLNPDGTLDTFFGAGGQIISFPNDNDGFFAVATDEKQRIVAAGFRGGELEVVRYDAKGRLDKKFGQRGITLADWGGTDDTVYAVATLPGGGVLVAGTSNGQFTLARFTSKGLVDTTFGSGGAKVFKPGSLNCAIGALAVRPDGTIIAAGTQGSTVVVLKMDALGNLDTPFGDAGVLTAAGLGVRTDLGVQDHSVGLAVGTDGRILVGNRTTGGDFGVRRYNADGSNDTTFDSDGLATVDFGGSDDLDFIGLQGSGQVVLAGTTDAGVSSGTLRVAVAVLKADGSTDTSFSAGGKFTVESALTTQAGGSGPYVIHVNGFMQTDGHMLLTAGEAFAKATSSPIRRLIVPGSGVLGYFGNVSGKNVKLSYVDSDGTKVSLSLKNGTGQALYDGSVTDLVLSGTNAGTSLAIKGKGGNGRVLLRDLRTDGALKAFSGKNTDIVGTYYTAGDGGKIAIGSLSGTLAVAGTIASLSVAGNVAGAFILSGVSLGTDSKIGGSGSAAETYAIGRIAKLSVGGQMAATFVGAGVDPQNGTFGDGDDRVVGADASGISAISVKKGIDSGSLFASGLFGSAKIPQRVDPLADTHFRVLPT